MTTRTSASLAALALLAASAAALRLASPASPAAVGLPEPDAPKPRIESAEVDLSELAEGRLRLAVRGQNVERYQIWAACPRDVRLEIGGANLCDSRLARDEDQLERQAISVDTGSATGTATITVKVDEPEVPAAAWTQKSLRVPLGNE